MELSSTKIWSPDEWEDHANNLLRNRHRHTGYDYIQIPDKHSGDGGIEGFSLDGYVYQMYCPQDVTSVSNLYEKQRDKMTADISKFINNSKTMKGYFGDLKIKRWVLVVPDHKSKDLVAHATKKTQEVKDSNLDYVDIDNFRVLIWDRQEFKTEETDMLNSGLAVLKLQAVEVPLHQIERFHSETPEFYQNLTRKLKKLPGNDSARKKAEEILTRNAIVSQNMMSELKQDYAEYHEKITTAAIRREEQLCIEAIDCKVETQTLSYQIDKLKENFNKSCKIHEDSIDAISKGKVADWLMNCTLDF